MDLLYITIDEKPETDRYPLKRLHPTSPRTLRVSITVDRWDEDWQSVGVGYVAGVEPRFSTDGEEHDRALKCGLRGGIHDI